MPEEASPTASAAAPTQPAASPCGPRPATGLPSPAKRAAAPRSRRTRKRAARRAAPSVSRRLVGERRRRRVARPDVGPAVACAGGHGAGPASGQRPQRQQRAPVDPPRPGRRAGGEGPGAGEPGAVPVRRRTDHSRAPCRHVLRGAGAGRRGSTRPAEEVEPRPPPFARAADPARDVDRERGHDPPIATRLGPDRHRQFVPGRRDDHAHPPLPEPRHRPHHVRPRQVALRDRVGAPQRQRRAAADPDPGHDPGVRRHRPGGLPRRGIVDQRRSRRPGPQVDDVAVGIDRRGQAAAPGDRRAQERRRLSRQCRRRPRVRPRPSRDRDHAHRHRGDHRQRCPAPGHPPMQSAPTASGR